MTAGDAVAGPDRATPSPSAGRTCIVIPCYNEAARLDVPRIRAFITGQTGVDLLFVDDGSTDGTVALIESLRAELAPRVALLRQPRNHGKGETVRVGMLECLRAGYRYTGFWDADLATPLPAVQDFLAVMETSPQYRWIIGARVRLLGRSIDRHAHRHYTGRVFATAASVTLGLPVYDTQCGAKLFRADDALACVLRTPFLSRWSFDVEMLARLKRVRGIDVEHEVVELPLREWRDVSGSKVRFYDFLRSGVDLVRVWAHYRGGDTGSPPTL
jgi:dolichyl-phosphate beta-glucosyltransferase